MTISWLWSSFFYLLVHIKGPVQKIFKYLYFDTFTTGMVARVVFMTFSV